MNTTAERRKRREEKNKRRRQQRRRALCFTLLFVGLISYVNINDVFGDDRKVTQRGIEAQQKAYDVGQEDEASDDKVDESLWNLILVNPKHKLPEEFTVELHKLSNGQAVDKRIYDDLQNMMDDARAQGLSPVVCSGYRTQEKQQSLFDNQINKYIQQGFSKEQAEKEAAVWVAIPGTSEHQVGLAVDIVSLNNQQLNKGQETTQEQQWLMENSYKYGFILRYPEDKSHITGIGYEPWHYRYVGKEVAKEIYERKICLEEYLGAENKN